MNIREYCIYILININRKKEEKSERPEFGIRTKPILLPLATNQYYNKRSDKGLNQRRYQ